jgi:hypothetical protein
MNYVSQRAMAHLTALRSSNLRWSLRSPLAISIGLPSTDPGPPPAITAGNIRVRGVGLAGLVGTYPTLWLLASLPLSGTPTKDAHTFLYQRMLTNQKPVWLTPILFSAGWKPYFGLRLKLRDNAMSDIWKALLALTQSLAPEQIHLHPCASYLVAPQYATCAIFSPTPTTHLFMALPLHPYKDRSLLPDTLRAPIPHRVLQQAPREEAEKAG